jgi:hypothetical protein
MGTGRTLNKAPKTRPKKSPLERRRREKTQRARLVEAGMDCEFVRKMTTKDLRENLMRVAIEQAKEAKAAKKSA